MMDSTESSVPTGLRERIVADLRPVRPLAEPWKRSLVLAPLALLLLAVVHARFGTRTDIGAVMLWGLSLLQFAVALLAVVAALRQVIPDREVPASTRAMLFVAGFGLAIAVTYLTWYASGKTAPPEMRYPYWRMCLRHTIEVGVPVLIAIMLLAARGVLWQPGLVGGLAGLAAGLVGDAGWRTFCDDAEPSHVLSAHFAGIVVLVIVGVVAGKLYAWLIGARRFPQA